MSYLPNAHALLVGIARYQHVASLPGTIHNDVSAIQQVLTNPALCAYPPAQVMVLQDEAATLPALRQALAQLAARTDADAIVTLYFSGHGAQIADGPQAGEYLLPVEADGSSPQALAASALSGAEFAAALRRIPARKVLVILDCCYAAGIAVLKAAGAPVQHGLPASLYERLSAGQGRAILAAADQNEVAYIQAGAPHSLFTQQLLDGLRGGAPSSDAYIRVFDLFEYVQPRVTAVARTQHPLFRADLRENFPIALRMGGVAAPLPTIAEEESFLFHAYVSYVDKGPDALWVWETLVPRLQAAGLRIVVSGDVEELGVARVVSIERGLRQARRVLVVLSPAYLADTVAELENVLAMHMDLEEGTYRVVPIYHEPVDRSLLPVRLAALTGVNLAHPVRAEREFTRLVDALLRPLPKRRN